MAFVRSSAAAASNNRADWMADGFLNFYLPTTGGGRRKVGAIPLRNSKSNEAKLMQWLEADPNNARVLLSKLVLDYQSATPSEGNEFDLD